MMTTIINWLATNWLAITILLGFLGWIAKKTDWTWDDKVIEYIKEILNLIFPGKKLYTIEEIESKGVAKIVEEEREYIQKRPIGRVQEEVINKFRKHKN